MIKKIVLTHDNFQEVLDIIDGITHGNYVQITEKSYSKESGELNNITPLYREHREIFTVKRMNERNFLDDWYNDKLVKKLNLQSWKATEHMFRVSGIPGGSLFGKVDTMNDRPIIHIQMGVGRAMCLYHGDIIELLPYGALRITYGKNVKVLNNFYVVTVIPTKSPLLPNREKFWKEVDMEDRRIDEELSCDLMTDYDYYDDDECCDNTDRDDDYGDWDYFADDFYDDGRIDDEESEEDVPDDNGFMSSDFDGDGLKK